MAFRVTVDGMVIEADTPQEVAQLLKAMGKDSSPQEAVANSFDGASDEQQASDAILESVGAAEVQAAMKELAGSPAAEVLWAIRDNSDQLFQAA